MNTHHHHQAGSTGGLELGLLISLLALVSSACAASGSIQIGVTADDVLQSLSLESPLPVDGLHVELGQLARMELGSAEEEPAVETDRLNPVATGCPAEGTRVLLIGDSLTVGLGEPMAAVAARCGTSFHHHGVIGSHVTEWVSDGWLLPRLAEAEPTVVMVSLGGNDFLRTDSARVSRAIRTFVGKIRTRGIQLLWISPPTMPFEDQARARQAWQQAMGEVHESWFPSETLDLERSADKIHLTPSQNRSFADTLWRWMASTTSADAPRVAEGEGRQHAVAGA